MPNTKEKVLYYIAIPFVLFYISSLAWNIYRHSGFVVDNVVALASIFFIIYFNKWLKIDKLGFVLLNVALLSHNGGSFGFYALNWGMWGYDNWVHFISSFAAAYMLFNFIAQKMHIRKNSSRRETVVDEHKMIFVFLVISCVVFLGSIIEVVEFGGFIAFGENRSIGGLLNTDAESDWCNNNYIDTMTDVLVNIFGSILGVFFYYYKSYKKREWMHY